MHCSHCRAPVGAGDGRFCSHCGTVLPDAARVAPYEYMHHPERFDAVEAAPGYAEAMAHEPSSLRPGGLAIGTLVAGGGLVMFYFFGRVGSESAPAAFSIALRGLPLLFVAIGVYVVYSILALWRAPWQRSIAVVGDERLAPGADGKGSIYYLSLQFRDGERRELATTADVASATSRADIGVAYVKRGELIAFRRFDP